MRSEAPRQSLLFEEQSAPSSTAVLISIQQQYFQQMLAGTKRYEFRRKYLRGPTDAFIYVPTQGIAGFIEFEAPIVAPIGEIASLAESQRTGGGDSIRSYMADLEQGFAVPVRSITPIQVISLNALRQRFSDFVAPQFYYLLDRKPALRDYLRAALSVARSRKVE